MADLTPRTRSESFLNGEELEPITRREHFYAGRENELPEGHQEPETREEWFIQKYREAGDVTVESLSITENGTYTAPSGKAYSPVSVDVPLPENAYLLKSIENVNIATFADGTDNFLKSLEVAIEPVQDLHGYDAPWVGGAGKNKFDSDTVLSAFTKNNNKYVGMPSYVADTYVISGGFKTNTRYTLSYKAYNNTSTSSNFRFIFSYTDETEEIIGGFVDTTTEKVIVGTSAENKTISKIKRRYGNGVELTLYDIQLEEGSTATSFAPYSNICPISGWSEVDVTVADDVDNPTTTETITIQLGDTYYGAKLDVVSGVLTLTDGFISSYNGETLPSTWISDRDVYAEGTTPTIGAEVCYKLATPQTIQLTPTIIKSLQGENNVFADSGDVIKLQYWGEVM